MVFSHPFKPPYPSHSRCIHFIIESVAFYVLPGTPENELWSIRSTVTLNIRSKASYILSRELENETSQCYPCRAEDVFHEENFLQHISRIHPPMVIPEKCAKRFEDLTQWIVKMHAYPVAYGGFSDVWLCLLRRQSPPERVAVKAIRPVSASDEEKKIKVKAVRQELEIWGRLSHQNILPLYGTTRNFGPLPAFVCPWAENGTLSEYLEKFGAQLGLRRRVQLLRDIADGLSYLHSHNIAHGDLSGTNVLIGKEGRAYLSDFGLSTLFEKISDATVTGYTFPGNIRWAAPELFKCEEVKVPSQLSSPQADVYSFGSVMLQILTGKLPFHGIRRVAQIVIMVSEGSQPPRELGWDGKEIPDVLWDFMRRCWAKPPDQWPSSKMIVRFIMDLQAGLCRRVCQPP